MSDLKISQLTQDTTPTAVDYCTTIKSPFGVGSNRKVLLGDLVPSLNTAWASQAIWAIDPANGNDSNVGAGTQQVQTIVFSANIITGNTVVIDFANIDLNWKTASIAFNTDNVTTLQLLTDFINGNIEATAIYDGLHTITMTSYTPGSQTLTNRAAVTGGASQATITITETVSAFTDSLQTWGELRRRMLAVGGHTVGANIYISPTYNGDDIIFDWGFPAGIYPVIHGTPTVIRNGTLTGLSLRNPAANAPNIVTDSNVSDWTPDIAFTSGRHLCMTSGNARGFCAGIVKNLGSHQARVGTFYDWVALQETNPANGDRYCIVAKPFAQGYSFKNASGFVEVRHMDLGNEVYTPENTVAPDSAAGGLQLTLCAIFFYSLRGSLVNQVNSILKYCPSLYDGAQLQNLAGVISNIADTEGQNEVEAGAMFECESGTLFQGVGASAIDDGFVRIYDAGFFDVIHAPGFAISVGNGGKLRIEKVWGSGNINQGLGVTNTGEVWGNLSQCTITGTSGDVFYCGAVYSWASILATNGVEVGKGMGGIIYNSATEYPIAGKIGLLNIITGIDLKTTGQTTLNTVIASSPIGKKLYITEILLIPTNANTVTIAPIVRVGKTAGFNQWAPLTTLTGLNTNDQIFSLATAANGVIRSLFSPGDVIKLDVQTGATATSLMVTAHVLGYFV